MTVKSHNRPSKDGYGYTRDSYDTGVSSVTGGNVFAGGPARDTVRTVQRSSTPVRGSSSTVKAASSPAVTLSPVPSRPAPDRPQAVYYTGYGGNGSDPTQADHGGSYVVDPVAYQQWLADMAAWEAQRSPPVEDHPAPDVGSVGGDSPSQSGRLAGSSKIRGSTLHIESPKVAEAKASAYVGYDALAGRDLQRDVKCKPRPTDNTPKEGRGGPGGQRKFIPWCD